MNEGVNTKEPEKVLTQKEAEEEIQLILQDIYLTGNNDREYSDIDGILKKLRTGKYLPQQAVNEAKDIFNRKNLR